MGGAQMERHALIMISFPINSGSRAAASRPRLTVWRLMCSLFWVPIFCAVGTCRSQATEPRATVIVVVGAPGEPEYGSNFIQQATLWQQASTQGGARAVVVGLEYPAGTNDLDLLKATLA